MALFQPSNIVPDVRAGIGSGVIDATQNMTVSWRINGQSALTSYSITIYENNSASTQLYSTGQITTGCPAYGTDNTGNPQFFSYTISAATLSSNGITNGNEYKLIIAQWWNSNTESITQSSASVFVTRATPTLSISAIGTSGVISTRYYTFSGTYTQAQGDVMNWLRWRIAYANDTDNPFYDSGNITGTMELSCYYDGFFANTDYVVRLTCQTENGVEADTGWVAFSCVYAVPVSTGELTAGCVGGTDALLVEWSKIGYIPGTASGDYSVNNGLLTLPSGSTVTWNHVGVGTMSFTAPWSIVWRGTLGYQNASIFTITQSTGNITLTYHHSSNSLILAKGGTSLVSQSGIVNGPTVTIILTATALYIRSEYMSGGLYPSETLYPSTTLYPKANTVSSVDTYTLSPSYTQTTITAVTIGGYQICDYIEVIDGTATASIIAAAITNGTYTPGTNANDYMLANFTSDLSAGTLILGNDTIQGFSLYRRKGNSANLVHIATTDAETSKIYDYSAASQQGPYTYYLFLIGTNTYIASPLQSGMAMPCWWNWTLMECNETDDPNSYIVLAAYKFRLNIESGAISNNNSPGILHNFTPYPKVQLAPQNYKGGTLTGLIGAVDWSDGQPKYVDTIAWRDALYALSLSQNPLFLKNRKGDLLRIQISGAISMTTSDATKEQMQTITLPWVEVGSADGVSLYSTEYVGVQSEEGTSTPQYYVDASDATADAEDIYINKKAVGVNGLIVGESEFAVEDGTLIAPQNIIR